MEPELTFIYEEGSESSHELTVYALSTCGFCKRALKFLKENSIKFRYIYYDELDREQKDKLKSYLEERFKKQISFPFCVINDDDCLVGFDQKEWEKFLLQK